MSGTVTSNCRLLAPVLAVVAIALGLPPAASDARAPASPCPPNGATELARGFAAIAFETGEDVYACYRRTGARYFLGSVETVSPTTVDGGPSQGLRTLRGLV